MSVNSTPRDWVSGEVVTAGMLNSEIRDFATGIQAPADTYLPTLSNWTLGNGTLDGRFRQVGKWINFYISYLAGSTSTFTGTPTFSLPVPPFIQGTGPGISGAAWLFDSSAGASNYWNPVHLTGNQTSPRRFDGVVVTPTSPWTWATGDRIIFVGQYEAL